MVACVPPAGAGGKHLPSPPAETYVFFHTRHDDEGANALLSSILRSRVICYALYCLAARGAASEFMLLLPRCIARPLMFEIASLHRKEKRAAILHSAMRYQDEARLR